MTHRTESFPVTVEPAAAERLKRLIARKGEPGQFVRIGVNGGGCSGLEYVIKLDSHRREDDLVLELGDLTVVCDSRSAGFLAGSRLKATANLLSGGLEFENPNAARSCGCGTSFTPKL